MPKIAKWDKELAKFFKSNRREAIKALEDTDTVVPGTVDMILESDGMAIVDSDGYAFYIYGSKKTEEEVQRNVVYQRKG